MQALLQESSEGFLGSFNDDAAVAAATKSPAKSNAKVEKPTVTTTKPSSVSASPTSNGNLSSTLLPIDCNNISSALLTTVRLNVPLLIFLPLIFPHLQDQDHCCNGPHLFEEETLFKCQISNNHRADWFYDDPPDNECIVQCMFESRNMTYENKTINKEGIVQEYLRNRINDAETWKPIVTNAVEECTKLERTHFNATGPRPSNCSPTYYLVLHCCYAQLMRNCPLANLNQCEECSQLLKFVQTCDFIPKHEMYTFN